jgi:hypothetical protein
MATSSLLNFTVPLGVGQSPSSQGLLMPKLQYRFALTFIGFGITNATTPLTIQAMTFSKPKLDFEQIVLDVYNSKVKLAGKPTWSDTSVMIRDDAQGQVSTLVGQQIQKQFDFAEQASASSGIDYKFQLLVEILDGGNGTSTPNILESWTLLGAWIKNVDYSELDYKSSEPTTIKMDISFDNALQGPQGVGTVVVPRTLGVVAI